MVWRSLEEIAEREFEDVTDSLGTAKVAWVGGYDEMDIELFIHIEDSNPEPVEMAGGG